MVCSTIALSELLPIAERARARGVTVIDCPVSGGVSGADAGTLTLLCGGDAAAFEAQRPLLRAMGANVVHMGPLGAGLVAKVANNLIIGVGRLAIGEAFAMAKQAGVPLDRLYHTLRTCTADSWILRSLEGAILRGEYPPATFLGLKDLTAAVESGRARAPGDAGHLPGPRALPAHRRQAGRPARVERGAALLSRSMRARSMRARPVGAAAPSRGARS